MFMLSGHHHALSEGSIAGACSNVNASGFVTRNSINSTNVSLWWLLSCKCLVMCCSSLLGVMWMSRYNPHWNLMFEGGEASMMMVSSLMIGSRQFLMLSFHSSSLTLSLCGRGICCIFFQCVNFSCALVPGGAASL